MTIACTGKHASYSDKTCNNSDYIDVAGQSLKRKYSSMHEQCYAPNANHEQTQHDILPAIPLQKQTDCTQASTVVLGRPEADEPSAVPGQHSSVEALASCLANCHQPGAEYSQLGAECSQPGVECTRVGLECSQPLVECSQAGVDCKQPEAECSQPGAECSQPPACKRVKHSNEQTVVS